MKPRDDLTAVMVSCHQRETARALTLPQLHAVGVRPRVFLDDCGPKSVRGEAGNKWVADEALAWAVTRGRPVLFLEDDIDLATDFADALDLALARDRITYLYLNESPDRMDGIYGPALAERLLAGRPTPLALTRARTSVGLFGTQAVLLPHAAAVRLRAFVPKVRKAIDAALQLMVTHGGAEVLVATPNVVQHRHDRTGREPDASVKRSLSYSVPRGASP